MAISSKRLYIESETESMSIAKVSDIPTKVSQLSNDASYAKTSALPTTATSSKAGLVKLYTGAEDNWATATDGTLTARMMAQAADQLYDYIQSVSDAVADKDALIVHYANNAVDHTVGEIKEAFDAGRSVYLEDDEERAYLVEAFSLGAHFGRISEDGIITWYDVPYIGQVNKVTLRLASEKYVQDAIAAIPSGGGEGGAVSGVKGNAESTYRTGNVNLTPANIGAAALASPTFTGTPKAPTATKGTNTTQIATTAFVQTATASFCTEEEAGDMATDITLAYINRMTKVNIADTNYTTCMARGISLHPSATSPAVNGAITLIYS